MRLKKLMIICFLVFNIILKADNYNEIVIDYGNRKIVRKDKYDFVELTEYKMVISGNMIRYLEPFSKEIKITEENYRLIYKIAEEVIQKQRLVNCYDNISVRNVYYEYPMFHEVPINVKIQINEKDYCMIGKNELLEFLNEEYDLGIVWMTGEPQMLEIKPLKIDGLEKSSEIDNLFFKK